jgi:hypothetical protein
VNITLAYVSMILLWTGLFMFIMGIFTVGWLSVFLIVLGLILHGTGLYLLYRKSRSTAR